MTRLDRIAVTSRIFGIAAVLGLSLALNTVSLQGTIILAAISGSAVAAEASFRVSQGWVAIAEGALSALVMGLVLPFGFALLPYLVVPALIAGLMSGFWFLAGVIASEMAALILIVGIAGGLNGFSSAFEMSAPWLMTAAGVGLFGAWLRRSGAGPAGSENDASYESARRLLAQLRTVARRLSSGLDTVSMSSHLLMTVNQHLHDTRAGLFVRTEGGILSPLSYRGEEARERVKSFGPDVELCWAESQPVMTQQLEQSQELIRIVLPLRAATRMLGVVVAEAPTLPSTDALGALMRQVDEQALRLDTALVFDEVRSMATIEERQRLAREIHDGVAQEIASLGYAVDDLAATVSTATEQQKLRELRRELSRIVSELRLSIFDLRSEVSPTAGLGAALSDYVREVGARSGMTVHLTLDEAPTRLRTEVETELLRIVQEAVTNARKHSAARNLWVNCRIQPPFAHIEVSDDGSGLRPPRPDSFGLRIMRERAKRINASLKVSGREASVGDTGTSVTVTVGATH